MEAEEFRPGRELPSVLKLQAIRRIDGRIKLPGSKSLANRILLLSALAEGETCISNLPKGDDVEMMVRALSQLGVEIEGVLGDERLLVRGLGGELPGGEHVLELGNAGTVMRPLAAALCYGVGCYELRGVERMHQRPIGGLMEGMRQLGARFDYLDVPGYPPLRVGLRGREIGGMIGGKVWMSGLQSSQFVSSVLMAAPLGGQEVNLQIVGGLVSQPYVEMTCGLMKLFGAKVEWIEGGCLVVRGGKRYRGVKEILVEGDASSASYFLAGAAISGGEITVQGCGLHSVQGDVRFAEVLEKMGAEVTWGDDWVRVKGREVDLSEGEKPLKGIDVNMVDMPDAAMTLAVVALFAQGDTVIRGIGNWRLKETDRLDAMSKELHKVGAKIEIQQDDLVIHPPEAVTSIKVDTYDDHRIAMSFSLLSFGGVELAIQNPQCVSKTFPDFFERLLEAATFY